MNNASEWVLESQLFDQGQWSAWDTTLERVFTCDPDAPLLDDMAPRTREACLAGLRRDHLKNDSAIRWRLRNVRTGRSESVVGGQTG